MRHALFRSFVAWPARDGQQRSRRQVALHRVDAYGPHEEPCAWIIPGAGQGTFFVYYATDSSLVNAWAQDPAITIFTEPGSVAIDRMTDAQGDVIAASEKTAAAVAPGGMTPNASALWVKQGVDMALVTCVVLAVQKLGASAPAKGWTSQLLPGRSTRTRCGRRLRRQPGIRPTTRPGGPSMAATSGVWWGATPEPEGTSERSAENPG
eukprot:s794_g3.t1